MPGLSRRLVFVVAFAIAAASCAEPNGGTSTTARPAGSATVTTGTSPATPPTNPPGQPVALLEVLDGDSLAVDLDGQREEVRLLGINTPEADECHGDAATEAMEAAAAGAEMVLVTGGEDDRDQFGRLLRHVFVDGVWINGRQVANGHAVALQTGEATESSLVEAEEDAFANSRGMWALDACGEIPPDDELAVTIGDIRYDPPGRDFENTEEEFVSIVNEGTSSVDLSGWTLRDESSQHRFGFPPVTIDGGDALRVRTGCGDDGRRDLYWCAGDAVWSNGGDTVMLQNADGTVIARFKYAGDF